MIGHVLFTPAAHEHDPRRGAQSPQFSEHLNPGVRTVLTVRGSMESRNAHGGTAPARVAEQRAQLTKRAASLRSWVEQMPAIRD